MRIEDTRNNNIFLYLPYDVVETILVRLPVKSLLRIKAVCKQWSVIISDPTFIHNHIQFWKKSFCSFLHSSKQELLKRVALENHRLKEELPALEYPDILKFQLRRGRRGSWCFCDGLFLVSCFQNLADYCLWNPSRRASKELRYPYPINYNSHPITGICYDQVEQDYKVVIVAAEHYAVFSCKNDSWSETRLTPELALGTSPSKAGVHCNGSVYWIRRAAGSQDCHQTSVLCFDGRDEELKIVCTLDTAQHYHNILMASQKGLYMVGFVNSSAKEMVIKKILPMEMEMKVQPPFSDMYPTCFTQENKLVLMQIFNSRNCRLYDCGRRRFAEKIELCFNFSCDGTTFCLHPYIENLFHF